MRKSEVLRYPEAKIIVFGAVLIGNMKSSPAPNETASTSATGDAPDVCARVKASGRTTASAAALLMTSDSRRARTAAPTIVRYADGW